MRSGFTSLQTGERVRVHASSFRMRGLGDTTGPSDDVAGQKDCQAKAGAEEEERGKGCFKERDVSGQVHDHRASGEKVQKERVE